MLYTNECQTQLERRRIIKFADDSVIVSRLNSVDIDRGPVLSDFIDWCKLSFLDINAFKTKDMCGEGGVVQRSLQREKDSGDSGK